MSVSLEKTKQTSKEPSPSPSSTEIYDLQRGNALLLLPVACHGILVIYFLDILTNFVLHLINLQSAGEEVAMKSCSGLPSPSAGIYTQGHLFMARAAETGGKDKKTRGRYFSSIAISKSLVIVPAVALLSRQCLGDGKDIKKTGALKSTHVFSEAKNRVLETV